MNKIRIIRACLVGGRHQAEGTILTIPGDLPETDAKLLVEIGRAEITDGKTPEVVPESKSEKSEEKPEPEPEKTKKKSERK